MSPVPLIEIQRRLAEAGRIRMGEKTDKGAPKRLTTWRITSPTRELVEQAAGLYGGMPGEWESPTGKQWEVVTTSAELPVLVMPGYSFRQGYEHRTSPTLVERRCDGVEQDDGKPCACNAEGFQGEECVLITRLTVALPELTTMLGWRLESKGDTAAKELLASMDLVQGVAVGRPFVPAKLRIVEKRGNKNGQATRFVVPILDLAVRYENILGGQGASSSLSSGSALPSGYVPIPAAIGNGTSLEEGLRAAETQTLTKPPRVALPDDDVEDDEPGASPKLTPDTSPAGAPPVEPREVTEKPLTLAQAKKKMNALIGQLRDGGYIKTEQLYAALAKARSLDVEHMIDVIESARDEEGVLHWAPLRDSLSLAEARDLHGRLARLWLNIQVDEGRL